MSVRGPSLRYFLTVQKVLEARKRMFLEVESCHSPVPESVGSRSVDSHHCLEYEGGVAAPINSPTQATSTDHVNPGIEGAPKYMVRTFWKSILDSNFPEGAIHHQIPHHYIRTEDYIVGDGNCMFRAISFALDGDQEKHSNVRKLIVDYMAETIDDRVGQEKADYWVTQVGQIISEKCRKKEPMETNTFL